MRAPDHTPEKQYLGRSATMLNEPDFDVFWQQVDQCLEGHLNAAFKASFAARLGGVASTVVDYDHDLYLLNHDGDDVCHTDVTTHWFSFEHIKDQLVTEQYFPPRIDTHRINFLVAFCDAEPLRGTMLNLSSGMNGLLHAREQAERAAKLRRSFRLRTDGAIVSLLTNISEKPVQVVAADPSIL